MIKIVYKKLVCNAKLSYSNLIKVTKICYKDLHIDSGAFPINNSLVSFIDTIYLSSYHPVLSTRMAILHAMNNIVSNEDVPQVATISLGLSEKSFHSNTCTSYVSGINKQLNNSSISMPKAHTYFTQNDCITVSLVGKLNKTQKSIKGSGKYHLILTKPLDSGVYIMNEQGIVCEAGSTRYNSLLLDHLKIIEEISEYCTFGTADVSGFDLAAQLLGIIDSLESKIEVNLSKISIYNGPRTYDPSGYYDCPIDRNLNDFANELEGVEHYERNHTFGLFYSELNSHILGIVEDFHSKEFIDKISKKGFLGSKISVN